MAGVSPGAGDVGVAVVGEDSFAGDAAGFVEGERVCEEGDHGVGPLVGVELSIGEASVVVDADVEVLVAGAVVEAARLFMGVFAVPDPVWTGEILFPGCPRFSGTCGLGADTDRAVLPSRQHPE